MRYIVLELEPQIRVCTKDDEPILFSNKIDAFRYANIVQKGLVYPITDTMEIFNKIKKLVNSNHTYDDLLDELTKLIDEVI